MFIFIAIFLVMYLSTGAVLARGDYARRLEVAGSRDLNAELALVKQKLKAINHSRNCWRGGQYGSHPGHDCDCAHKLTWKTLQTERVALEAGIIDVRGPYGMFFGWPVVGLHNFLTNGKVKNAKGYNPALTARLERDLLELEE